MSRTDGLSYERASQYAGALFGALCCTLVDVVVVPELLEDFDSPPPQPAIAAAASAAIAAAIRIRLIGRFASSLRSAGAQPSKRTSAQVHSRDLAKSGAASPGGRVHATS